MIYYSNIYPILLQLINFKILFSVFNFLVVSRTDFTFKEGEDRFKSWFKDDNLIKIGFKMEKSKKKSWECDMWFLIQHFPIQKELKTLKGEAEKTSKRKKWFQNKSTQIII